MTRNIALRRVGSVLILFITCFLYGSLQAEEVLTWENCLVEAKHNNPDLIFAVEGVKEKEAGKDITASAFSPRSAPESTPRLQKQARPAHQELPPVPLKILILTVPAPPN